jgi:hypothetical protein
VIPVFPEGNKMQKPDPLGLCRCGLCSWEGQFRRLLVHLNAHDEFHGVWCPNCQERGYIEFKFRCEANPDEIIGYMPKRLPPPTALDKKLQQMAPSGSEEQYRSSIPDKELTHA